MRAILLSLALGCASGAPCHAQIRETVSNHLRIWECAGHRGAFTIIAVVGVGSRDEPAGKTGISHFLEHCLFQSSRRRSTERLTEALRDAEGRSNAMTTKDLTAYHVSVPTRHWKFAVDWLAEIFTEPGLLAKDVEGERLVVLEELAQNDAHVGSLAIDQVLYPGQAVGRPIGGTPADLQRVAAPELSDWHSEHYVRPEVVIAFGGVVGEDCRTHIAKSFAALPDSDRLDWRRNDVPQWLVGTRFTGASFEQTGYLYTGWHVRPSTATDYASLLVATAALDQELFDEARSRRHLVYSPSASFDDYTGAWRILCSGQVSDRNHVVPLADAVQVAVDAVVDVDDHRFDRARKRVAASLQNSTPQALLRNVLRHFRLARQTGQLPDLGGEVARLGRESTMAFVAESLTKANRFTLTSATELTGNGLLALWVVLGLVGTLLVLEILRRRQLLPGRAAASPRIPPSRPHRPTARDVDEVERSFYEYFEQDDRGHGPKH